MPLEAMRKSSDSQNLPPLRCSPDERPPVQLTPGALVELLENRPTLAIPDPFDQGDYECPFCGGPCARDYCYGCHSELLEDNQDE